MARHGLITAQSNQLLALQVLKAQLALREPLVRLGRQAQLAHQLQAQLGQLALLVQIQQLQAPLGQLARQDQLGLLELRGQQDILGRQARLQGLRVILAQ